MTNDRDHVSVERVIPAPASAIFDLLADPGRHLDIDGSGTVLGARSAGRRLTLGDSFGMNMKMGARYATRNEIVEFEENRRIAWRTMAPAPLSKVFTGRTWRYELEQVEGGTLVRETWDISTEAPLGRPFVRRMSGMTRKSITRTLARIEELVTA